LQIKQTIFYFPIDKRTKVYYAEKKRIQSVFMIDTRFVVKTASYEVVFLLFYAKHTKRKRKNKQQNERGDKHD